jgi:formiminotetrahydrofolate cyclodeaminase
LSDVVVGRHLLLAGLLSAKANVEVNLAGITDEAFCREKRGPMQQALAGPLYVAYCRSLEQLQETSS